MFVRLVGWLIRLFVCLCLYVILFFLLLSNEFNNVLKWYESWITLFGNLNIHLFIICFLFSSHFFLFQIIFLNYFFFFVYFKVIIISQKMYLNFFMWKVCININIFQFFFSSFVLGVFIYNEFLKMVLSPSFFLKSRNGYFVVPIFLLEKYAKI